MLFDGSATVPLVDADPAVASACVAPTLLGCTANRASATLLHQVEVFGPVATLMAYDDEDPGPGS